MDALTGFAAASDGMAVLDSIRILFSFAFAFAISVFVAVCWFFIGRRRGIGHSWLAFVPLVGHYVAWRASKTGVWTFVTVLFASIIVPVSIIVLFGSALMLVVYPAVEAPAIAFGNVALVAVLSLLGLTLFGIAMIAILTWWTYRVARELGFSWWAGLLASPLARLIPIGGQIVRLVFLGIIAFRREPL